MGSEDMLCAGAIPGRRISFRDWRRERDVLGPDADATVDPCRDVIGRRVRGVLGLRALGRCGGGATRWASRVPDRDHAIGLHESIAYVSGTPRALASVR
jgi:hypothetical protein